MFTPFIPTAQDLANWIFFLKLFGGVALALMAFAWLLEHVVEPYFDYRLTKVGREHEAWRDRKPDVIYGKFGAR